jgi:outer membrane protein TolC
MDQVAREVVEAHAQVVARKQQIEIAQQGVAAAVASHQRNVARIRDAQGLPIEVLQSNQALTNARRDYLRGLIDYNEAQFALYRAIGWPATPAALGG